LGSTREVARTGQNRRFAFGLPEKSLVLGPGFLLGFDFGLDDRGAQCGDLALSELPGGFVAELRNQRVPSVERFLQGRRVAAVRFRGRLA